MVHSDLHRYPVDPTRSVDVVRASNTPRDLVIMRSGRIRLSTAIMAHLGFPVCVMWKYVGDDGFNFIGVDEWEYTKGTTLMVKLPRPEQSMDYFAVNVPAAYRVGVIPGDYTTRIDLSTFQGRGVVGVPNSIDKDRLHCAHS